MERSIEEGNSALVDKNRQFRVRVCSQVYRPRVQVHVFVGVHACVDAAGPQIAQLTS